MEKKPIGQLLKELGYVTEEQIHIALEVKKIKGGLLGEILVALAFVSPIEVAEAIAIQAGKPFIDLAEYPPDKEALGLINKELALQLEIIPLKKRGDVLDIAMTNPYDINAVDIVRRRTGLDINIFVTDKESLKKAIEINYFLLEHPIESEIENIIQNVKKGNITSYIPRLVNLIIDKAIIERATDIHISPENLATHIFYRIDGIMRHFFSLPSSVHSAIASRIKVLAGLDIAEQRLPQDGSFSYEFFNEEYDFRVSTVLTAYGENIVLRILYKNISLFNLKKLGFEEYLYKKIENALEKPQGIFLVTGPTGSGKTTTLYASLRRINSLHRNILAVEDPIEYKFPFIKQTQVNEKAGFTFARAIKAFLRQDPDVILVGEIRDKETAEMAIRASITGHLVLSTLHTNDAVSAIPRLTDIGIKEYMVAAGVYRILAQRLIRKVCNFCKEEIQIPIKKLIELGFDREFIQQHTEGKDHIKINRGKGCDYCNNTGFLGRVAIGELLVIDDEIGDMIIRKEPPLSILYKAKNKGMLTLKEDGFLKVIKGLTTPEEVIRVVG
ncbi:MAG: type II/IV secretion system protein [Aquificae bacterium]|nr:type II/IV secretion system protein [Aquificota bacterium]